MGCTVRATRLGAKGVKRRHAACGDFEDCPAAGKTKSGAGRHVVSTAKTGCPVEVPIRALNERTPWVFSIGPVETHKSGERLRQRRNRRRGTKHKGHAGGFR